MSTGEPKVLTTSDHSPCLAVERPCTRCIAIGKSELCIDLPVSCGCIGSSECLVREALTTLLQHKKRGRPKTSATSKPSSQSSPTRRKRQSDSAATTTTINNNNAIGLDILATSPTSTLSNALDTTRISPSADTHPRSRTRAQSVESRSGLTSAASLNRDSTIHFFCNLALTLLEVATNAPDSPPSQDWSGMLDACLADFVHPQDVESFLEARSRALNPRRRVRAGELRFGSLTRKDLKGYSHANLLLEAPGFQQTYCSRRIRFPECSSASYEVRFRVGGCLGANGLEPKTLDKGYFIVSLTNAIEEPTPQRGSTSSSEPNMTPSTSSSNSMPPFPAGTSLPPLSSIVAGLPEPEPRPPWTHLASPSQDLANPLSPRHDPFAKLDRDDRIDRRRRNELPQLLMPTNSFDGLPGGSLSPYPRPPLISPSNLSDSWTPTMMQQSPSSRSNQGSKDSPA